MSKFLVEKEEKQIMFILTIIWYKNNNNNNLIQIITSENDLVYSQLLYGITSNPKN